MHFAAKAGIQKAAPLGKGLNAASGHYMRHLKQQGILSGQDESLYEMTVPGVMQEETGPVGLVTMLPHELLEVEVADDPDFQAKLQEKRDSMILPLLL